MKKTLALVTATIGLLVFSTTALADTCPEVLTAGQTTWDAYGVPQPTHCDYHTTLTTTGNSDGTFNLKYQIQNGTGPDCQKGVEPKASQGEFANISCSFNGSIVNLTAPSGSALVPTDVKPMTLDNHAKDK